jgi:SulP family sulfate permease
MDRLTAIYPTEKTDSVVSLLDIYGSLRYAAVYAMEDLLPSPEEAEEAVVILRLRGRDEVSSTFIEVIERFAQQLQAKGSKLMLAGVHEHIKTQLENTETTETIAEEDIFLETTTRRESTQTALGPAEQWLEAKKACVLSRD